MGRRSWTAVSRALMAVGLVSAICFITMCSDSKGPEGPDEPDVVLLSISPDSASPGAIVKASGFDHGLSTSDIVVEIGGKFSPASVDSGGSLYCAVPLFLTDGGVMEIPQGKVDVIVKRDGKVIGEAKDALTITELPEADGSLEYVAAELDTVLASLNAIFSSFVQEHGVQEQYLLAFLTAMDSLLHGTGENSLASAIEAVPQGGIEEKLVDYIASSSGLVDFVHVWADYLQSVEGDLTSLRRTSAGASVAATQVSDEELARMMEFYTIVQHVGSTKIRSDGQTVLHATGTIVSTLGYSGDPVKQALVCYYVFGFFGQIALNFLPATLPSEFDAFELEVSSPNVSPGDTTESEIRLQAGNEPYETNLEEWIDQIIVNLCDSSNASRGQLLRTQLEAEAVMLVGEMTSSVASYASQYPELQLNPNLAEDVPAMSWSADATSLLLYDRRSDPNNIVMPCASVMEWYALDDAQGTAVLTVAPSTSPSGWLLPQMPGVPPYLGSFGDVTQTSNSMAVYVDPGTLIISAAIAPSRIPEGRTGQLNVQCRYHTETDSTPAPDVAISLSPSNCSVDPTGGTTDADGVFRSTVTPTADTISITVSGTGIGGSSSQATATATRGRDLLWECYNDYGGNCFYFKVKDFVLGDTVTNAFMWGYNPELNYIGGNWWWGVSNIGDRCSFDGTFMGHFDAQPNSDYNGFTFEMQPTWGWIHTFTAVVSKDQSGECVWTVSCTSRLVNP